MNSLQLTGNCGAFNIVVSLQWNARVLALFGASGAGKSTVIEAMAGLRPALSGSWSMDGAVIPLRAGAGRGVAFAPQDALLFPHLSARGNIDLATRGRPRPDLANAAIEALELAALLDQPANVLSGGERQRVSFVRALAAAPRVLLLDEPFSALDWPLRQKALSFLVDCVQRTKLHVVFVSHDPIEVLAVAEEVAVLEAGKVLCCGAPAKVLHSAQALDALPRGAVENVFVLESARRDGDVVLVRTARGQELVMAAPSAECALPNRVGVSAEDVLLATGRPEGVSAQNVFAARVSSIEPAGTHTWVRLLAGDEAWTVRLTRRAVQQLALQPGVQVTLILKAHSIRAV